MEYVIDQDEIFFLIKIMSDRFFWPERRVQDHLKDFYNKGILRILRYDSADESYHDANLSEIDWKSLDEQLRVSLAPTKATFAMYDALIANESHNKSSHLK